MNDLDHRLRTLAPPSDTAGDDLGRRAASLRGRAAERRARRHRRNLALAAIPAVVLVAAAAVALVRDDDHQTVRTGPTPTATTDASGTSTTSDTTTGGDGASRSLGTIEGVTIAVSPRTGLTDGDVVEVEIEGLDQIDTPLLVMCAGDLTAETAGQDCDLRQLERAEGSDPDAFGPIERVSVRRHLTLPRDSPQDQATPAPFDCATEPAGCVIAIGDTSLPAKGAYVPIEFGPASTQPEPTLELSPDTGLTDGQPIAVTATGLRPNSSYSIIQCSTAADGGCDESLWPTARTDDEGRFTTEVDALAALYGWKGRVDCTEVPCEVVVSEEGAERIVTGPISYAPGVRAPVPQLQISPAGPYRDDQVVTITGTGFPPGTDIGSQIGQCPVGKDTAVEERCMRPTLGQGPVADDGTFSIEAKLSDTLLFTGSCVTAPGCHIGWVINHGPTVATAPLTFVP